jgi:hypothetical protein
MADNTVAQTISGRTGKVKIRMKGRMTRLKRGQGQCGRTSTRQKKDLQATAGRRYGLEVSPGWT